MKKPYARRCGASLPRERADVGWYWCDQKQGHTGHHTDHTDGVAEWRDQDSVCVVSYDNVRAVPDHVHDFVGDQDLCVALAGCELTYGESRAQHREWELAHADICSHCGHGEGCHTMSPPEKGSRDYCTECDGADEFHAFDEEPVLYTPSREALVEALRKLTGPSMPQERLEAAAERAYVLLGHRPEQDVAEPQEATVGRLEAREGARAIVVSVDELAYVNTGVVASIDATAAVRQDEDDDLAVECECGTIWPDGVMDKGHNDMNCDQVEEEIPQAPQNLMDDDVCFCGCTRKQHRKSLNWGESCEGCTAKGPRATYQWRHPFQRDVGVRR